MKVLVNRVVIENLEFVLIQDVAPNGDVYYGTISYDELDDSRCLIRALNGFDMEVSFDSPAAAIDNRRRSIVIKRLFNDLRSRGLSEEESFRALSSMDEFISLYA